MQALQTVHVRVSDAATGQPTPVRIRVSDGAGDYYAPFGRLTHFATGRNQDVGGNIRLAMKAYAYIDGACEIAVPPGPLHVRIDKGPEYRSIEQDIDLAAGKLALRFTIERWINLREIGWYSGDARAHCLSPHAALLEAAAEDVAVVNLLVRAESVGQVSEPADESGRFGNLPHDLALSNILAFSGQKPALEMPGHLVAVNTQNTHVALGSLGLLHCHRIVYPLMLADDDDWCLADWCDQCHRKHGLVVWTNSGLVDPEHLFGEALADLILGKVDAFEIEFFEDSPFDVLPQWYVLLNAGLRIPLVGASGKESNAEALGVMRTYARVRAGDNFSYMSWIEAVRGGRTFVTNGPVLPHFRVQGQEAGSVLELPAGQTVRVEAKACGIVPYDHLELLWNGAVVASVPARGESPCVA